MAAQPAVRGYAGGDYGQLDIGGLAVPAIGIDPLHGRGFLTLLAGHPPSGPGQVVLGERTLRALHRHIGQTVRVSINGTSRTMLILGVATLAQFSQATSAATDLGTGAAVYRAGALRAGPPLCAPGRTCYNSSSSATAPVPAWVRPQRGCRPSSPGLVTTGNLPGDRDQRPPTSATTRPHETRPWPSAPYWPCSRSARSPSAGHQRPPAAPRAGHPRDARAARPQLLWVVGWEATALAAAAMVAGLPLGLSPAAGPGRCSLVRWVWPAPRMSRCCWCCSPSRSPGCWLLILALAARAAGQGGTGRSCGRSGRMTGGPEGRVMSARGDGGP